MEEEMGRIFQALACGTRLRLLELLRGRTFCVCALARRLGVTDGAVSQHLRVLRDAGLVTGERQGYRVHYRLCRDGVDQCREALGALLGEPGEDDSPASETEGKEKSHGTRREDVREDGTA